MNKAGFKRAFAVASSDQDLSGVDDGHLFGFGLWDFNPTATTIEAVAKMIRWQALQFNGQWDHEALEVMKRTVCDTGPCGVAERDICCFLCPEYNQCPHEYKCTSIELFVMLQGCPKAFEKENNQ